MAFRFRLQSVLKLRQSVMKDRQMELAQAIQADQILAQQHQQIVQEIQDIEGELRQCQQQAINVDTLMSLRRTLGNARLSLRELEHQQGEVAQEIERRQLRLATANQEVKVMEKLKEQQHQDFQKQLLKQEQASLDEFRPRSH